MLEAMRFILFFQLKILLLSAENFDQYNFAALPNLPNLLEEAIRMEFLA